MTQIVKFCMINKTPNNATYKISQFQRSFAVTDNISNALVWYFHVAPLQTTISVVYQMTKDTIDSIRSSRTRLRIPKRRKDPASIVYPKCQSVPRLEVKHIRLSADIGLGRLAPCIKHDDMVLLNPLLVEFVNQTRNEMDDMDPGPCPPGKLPLTQGSFWLPETQGPRTTD